jgi:hypothetical protein
MFELKHAGESCISAAVISRYEPVMPQEADAAEEHSSLRESLKRCEALVFIVKGLLGYVEH